MITPGWIQWLLRRLAGPEAAEDLLGDVEESHRQRLAGRGAWLAVVLTTIHALDLARALVARRIAPRGAPLSRLDFKLGLRMLVRYPGLTIVGALAMACGITLGASTYQIITQVVSPDLPYSEPDRIVGIQSRDTRTTGLERRLVHDFYAWRDRVESVDRLGAKYSRQLNLAVGNEVPRPTVAMAISSTAFELAPVPPLLGRPLLPADEESTAPPVTVLTYELFQGRFGGDADVLGRVVRLGGVATTVVGVMPERFELPAPSNDFIFPPEADLWIPFRLNPLDYERGEGPILEVFGELAPGRTAEDAQTELTAIGAGLASEWPDTHEFLRPEVATFAKPLGIRSGMGVANVFAVTGAFLLLAMVTLCANVALLLYARAATRQDELVIRGALGASRLRIVGQLFAESLALAATSILVGLAGATLVLRWVVGLLQKVTEREGVPMPWVSDAISPSTAVVAVALAVVGACVAGVLPGLSVTRRPAARLRGAGYTGTGGSLGRIWTFIIVLQVALTSAFVPVATFLGVHARKLQAMERGFPASQYLAATLDMDASVASSAEPGPAAASDAFLENYRDLSDALLARLSRAQQVTGVTIASRLPGQTHGPRGIEIEGADPLDAPSGQAYALVAEVDERFFEIFDATVVAGRGFLAAEVGAESGVVVVNRSFAEEFFGSEGAVGRRIRFFRDSGAVITYRSPWHQIVGVVEDLLMTVDPLATSRAGLYQPLGPDSYPIQVAAHAPGGAAGFDPELRRLTREVSPALQLHRVRPLDEASHTILLAFRSWFLVLSVIAGVAILLTNAGIYATVSFAVSRRTREIGVRVALGADRWKVMVSVLSRMVQLVALGVVGGGALGLLMAIGIAEGRWVPTPGSWWLILLYVTVMMGVCMMAVVAPARRALGIEPREALSAEA